MTRGELADLLDLKESYLQAHWQKALAAQKNRGIDIVKIGRGDTANYGIKFPWDYDYCWSLDEIDMMG